MSFFDWAKSPLGLATLGLAGYYIYTETKRGKEIGDELFEAGQEFVEAGEQFITSTFDTIIDTSEDLLNTTVDAVEDMTQPLTEDEFSNMSAVNTDLDMVEMVDMLSFDGSKPKNVVGTDEGGFMSDSGFGGCLSPLPEWGKVEDNGNFGNFSDFSAFLGEI